MKTILRKELGYTLSVHKISKTCTKLIMSVHKTGFSCTEDLEKRLFELEKSYDNGNMNYDEYIHQRNELLNLNK